MCGIVGYVGGKKAVDILIEGLKRLEYRGYDSAGIALPGKDKVEVIKEVGRIAELSKKITGREFGQTCGIAHTRWATHGKPSTVNAHPHTSCSGKIALVHNGIIENYQELKKDLSKKGHKFVSETDTEVLVHLVEEYYKGNLEEAVKTALSKVLGAYGICVISSDEPEKIVAARMGSPLIIGVGNNENFFASDVSAILGYTKQVIYLNDGEIVVATSEGISITRLNGDAVRAEIAEIEMTLEQSQKSGHPHYMLKEIMEQPQVVVDSTKGRLLTTDGNVRLGGLKEISDKLRDIERIIIVACGTARLAGLVGEYMLEEYAGIPVEVEYASEFRYRKPLLSNKVAVLAISQSGETADTLAAIREAKEKEAVTLGIVNVVGSTIARETDAGIYNHAGPEIAVASTKAMVSQMTVLALLTILLGRERDMSLVTGKRITEELEKLPGLIEKILAKKSELKKIAAKYKDYRDFMYLGRKYNFPVAEEGALKLKEISYIHAEGYAAGEMKHGPIAMIDKDFPTVAICPKDSVYDKNVSNIEEIKARNGKIVAIATEGDKVIKKLVTDVFYIPKTLEMLTPILSVIPLQLFAYYVASAKGLDVDKPRNLAKSVTVE